MLRRILVPLDGTALAEDALPYALELVTGTDAEVVLVRTTAAPQHVGPARWFGSAGPPASADLAEYGQRLLHAGVLTDTAIAEGPPPRALLAEVDRWRPDLVVMAAHPRSAIRRLLAADLCDTVIRSRRAPVLLVPPSLALPPGVPRIRGRRLLVALDGSQRAEAVLPTALELARALDSALLLFQAVVPPPLPCVAPHDFLIPEIVDLYWEWDADEAIRSAGAYLRRTAEWLVDGRAQGAVAVDTQVQIGGLAEQIRAFEDAARARGEPGSGLIVMATHARAGLSRALLGSTTDDVLRLERLPLVVVCPPLLSTPPRVAEVPGPPRATAA